jgi:outer membrane protein assembly factor BamE (lipoprotein component of BamABCDE complex)
LFPTARFAYAVHRFLEGLFAMSRPLHLPLLVLLLASLLPGCAEYENRRGVEVTWQDTVTRSLAVGSSTRKDVLGILGPPSQVIALGDETVLYYLFEHSSGQAMVLIVYNRFDVDTRYDRAIFFFNEQDVLTDYATRLQDVP